MYFLVSLGLAAVAAVLWFFFRDRKALHLDILTITYGASTLMWFIDCIASAIKGEGFLSFDNPKDGWIALATFGAGLFLWLIVSFILNNSKKTVQE